MNCCVVDLKSKEVINACDGAYLGNVCDVEIDTCSGRLAAIIVKERSGCFGPLASIFNPESIIICWENISVIGNDTIIVNYNCPTSHKRNKRNFLDGLFR